MQMRLAFSVACAKRPDILIVDEALSVGDAYFQHKSFERIRQFRREGTTLLLVSHDKAAVQSICDRAILLNAGKIETQGEPEAVLDLYNALLAQREKETVRQHAVEGGRTQTVSGTGEASIIAIALLDAHGKSVEVVDVGQPVRLCIEARANASIDRLVLGYGIKDRLGQVIYGTNTELRQQPLLKVSAGARYLFNITFHANLGPGTYSIQVALVGSDTHLVSNYEWRDLALVFNVVNVSKPPFTGCAWMDPSIEISQA
jgi:lipopolysaccharide transport system ATP-binding protein